MLETGSAPGHCLKECKIQHRDIKQLVEGEHQIIMNPTNKQNHFIMTYFTEKQEASTPWNAKGSAQRTKKLKSWSNVCVMSKFKSQDFFFSKFSKILDITQTFQTSSNVHNNYILSTSHIKHYSLFFYDVYSYYFQVH